MNESEQLFLIRFRYGRTAEALLAYKTFLKRQVLIGGKNYCQNEEIVEQVTHTLLICFFSFVYSMFDKNGTDFISATEQYVPILSEDGKRIRIEIIELWKEYESPIRDLRNNAGFHGGTKVKSLDYGYNALYKIHPQVPELIVNQMARFFIELDEVVSPSLKNELHVDKEQAKAILFNKSAKLKAEMSDSEYIKMQEYFKKVFG